MRGPALLAEDGRQEGVARPGLEQIVDQRREKLGIHVVDVGFDHHNGLGAGTRLGRFAEEDPEHVGTVRQVLGAAARADGLDAHHGHRSEGLRQLRDQRRARRGDQFAVDLAAVAWDAPEQERGGRCGHGHDAVRTLYRAGTHVQG